VPRYRHRTDHGGANRPPSRRSGVGRRAARRGRRLLLHLRATRGNRIVSSRDSILLVEDNPDDRDLTVMAFKEGNIANRIDIARDGQEALDYFADPSKPLPAL